jgi:hypothetical protein
MTPAVRRDSCQAQVDHGHWKAQPNNSAGNYAAIQRSIGVLQAVTSGGTPRMSLDGRASSILFASPAKLILQAASGTNPKRIFSSALGPVDRHDRGHISLGLRFARGFQACGHKCDPPRQVTPVVGFADGAPVGLRRGVRGFCPCHDLNIDTNAAGRTVEGKDSNHRGLDAEPTVHPDRPCYGEGWRQDSLSQERPAAT